MKIDNIKKLSNGKYKLTLDDKEKLITYDDVILKNNLLFNKEIDTKLLNKINNDTIYYDVYNKTINYISLRMRSKKEIKIYLEKYNLNDKDYNEILSNLERLGLINDKLYAKAYASDRINLSNDGPNKIKEDLTSHDINEDEIISALNSIDEHVIEDKLEKLIQKKIKSNHKHSNYMLKQKLIMELVNLGYHRDQIARLIDLNLVDNNILNSEYDKLFSKLSRKLEGKDLMLKIKQKLYQKGFDINEINELMSTKWSE